MTSHYDIPATLLPLLGVRNPQRDYCMGFDLLESEEREYVLAGDWSNVVYLDKDYKAIMPFRNEGMFRTVVLANDDTILRDPGVFFRENKEKLAQMLVTMSSFNRPH